MKLPAIVVDLDGTLVNNDHRILQWEKYKREDRIEEYNQQILHDLPNEWCQELVRAFSNLGYKIIFLTARTDMNSCRRYTEEWLLMHVGPGVDYTLLMRTKESFDKNEPAWLMKYNMYALHINPIYDVKLAVDDTQQVIQMWRDSGVAGLHCSDR